METGEHLHFIPVAFAGFHEAHLRMLIGNGEENLQLPALYDRRDWDTKRTTFPERNQQTRKLSRTQTRLG
jgi:hypothetical protein